jgi:hypothetical protein
VIIYLSDPPLHNQEIWVVDVELHALEEQLNRLLSRFMSIEKIF